MPYELPVKLPAELDIQGKTYKLIVPRDSVKRGVCKGNDGSWFYYFNKRLVDGDTANIGNRRHFSVRKANGQRAVHISLKPQQATFAKAEKRDDIQIWYCYDDCWDGRKMVKKGWGKTPTGVWDRDRVDKALDLLQGFLEAMHAAATTPSTPPPPQPNPRPQAVMIPATVAPPQAPPPPVVLTTTVVDSWEDL